jgi:hypothetical protein
MAQWQQATCSARATRDSLDAAEIVNGKTLSKLLSQADSALPPRQLDDQFIYLHCQDFAKLGKILIILRILLQLLIPAFSRFFFFRQHRFQSVLFEKCYDMLTKLSATCK